MFRKKNPAAMPEFVSFIFFDETMKLDSSAICESISKLLEAWGAGTSQVDLVSDEADQISLMIGDVSGVILHRMPGSFPLNKLDLDDPNIERVRNSVEHWVLTGLVEEQPIVRLIGLLHMSFVMQAIGMSHRVRALMLSPMGIVYRGSEWSEVVNQIVTKRLMPVRWWLGYDYLERDGRDGEGVVDVVSMYMDEVIGLPNVEIVGSRRSVEETIDLLECGVLETVMRGPIQKRGKVWETKTGVRFKVKWAESVYDPSRKVVRLIEIR